YGFVLGVECDGASYHSAKSARDRDRLRQEVLQHLGWKLHRIWSTDWFNNPRREVDRLRESIVARLQELKKREFEYATTAAPRQPEKTEPAEVRETVIALPLLSQESAPAQGIENQTPKAVDGVRIAIGDTVRVKYLTDDQRTVQ